MTPAPTDADLRAIGDACAEALREVGDDAPPPVQEVTYDAATQAVRVVVRLPEWVEVEVGT